MFFVAIKKGLRDYSRVDGFGFIAVIEVIDDAVCSVF